MVDKIDKQILVAEDEKPLARALQLKLEGAGFGVEVVHTGTDAVQALETKNYRVLLLDLMMPQGDGFSVIEAAQQKTPKPAIVVMSNLSQGGDQGRALEAGAGHYFIKGDTSLATIVDYVKSKLKKK